MLFTSFIMFSERVQQHCPTCVLNCSIFFNNITFPVNVWHSLHLILTSGICIQITNDLLSPLCVSTMRILKCVLVRDRISVLQSKTSAWVITKQMISVSSQTCVCNFICPTHHLLLVQATATKTFCGRCSRPPSVPSWRSCAYCLLWFDLVFTASSCSYAMLTATSLIYLFIYLCDMQQIATGCNRSTAARRSGPLYMWGELDYFFPLFWIYFVRLFCSVFRLIQNICSTWLLMTVTDISE